MTRVKLVQSADEFPLSRTGKAGKHLKALFDHVASWGGGARIPDTGKVFAVVARDPKLALLLIKVSDYMTQELPWTTDRNDLRQLMIQTVNLHFKCDYNFQSHLAPAERQGISAEMQAAIPFWKISNIFDREQKLVIEFTLAAVAGDVPEELFQRVSSHFGERGAIEFTVAVAWWSFWAIICNAILPEHDFGYAHSSANGAKATG